jgi:uncharacterized protein YkwD
MNQLHFCEKITYPKYFCLVLKEKRSLVVFSRISLLALSLFVLCAASYPHYIERGSDRKGRPYVRGSDLENQIHLLINKERNKKGLPLLKWDATLASIARKHSRDMVERNYFSHVSPDGHDFSYRYKRDGYACAVRVGRIRYLGAENIALNYLYDSVAIVNNTTYYDWNSEDKIAQTTVNGWMKSPGHRRNILTQYFNGEGIGVFISPDDKVFITQNFC